MKRRKYKVTTRKPLYSSWGMDRGHVLVKVKRHGLFRRPSKERDVSGKYHVAPDGNYMAAYHDPPTDTQIRKVAWELVAAIEFPKPELEWCKTECEKLT